MFIRCVINTDVWVCRRRSQQQHKIIIIIYTKARHPMVYIFFINIIYRTVIQMKSIHNDSVGVKCRSMAEYPLMVRWVVRSIPNVGAHSVAHHEAVGFLSRYLSDPLPCLMPYNS